MSRTVRNTASRFPSGKATGRENSPGGNTGTPGSFVPGFLPDLRKFENRMNLAILVKF